MNHPWTFERAVETALARDLIEDQFAELAPAAVELLGLGWDNTAYLVNGEWIFRFPRRAMAVPLIEREARLLPALASRVPLPIPVPRFLGRASPRYPWPFSGYRKLEGRTACSVRMSDRERATAAAPLARFLTALHAFSLEEARGLGAGGDELGRTDVESRSAKALQGLADLVSGGVLERTVTPRLERVIADAHGAEIEATVALVHGDLYTRHLLVDSDGTLNGVIDWGDVHIGHPAVDLAIAHIFLPPACRDEFRRAYGPITDATWQLARFRALYHSTSVALYGRRVGDPDLEREARLALGWLGE